MLKLFDKAIEWLRFHRNAKEEYDALNQAYRALHKTYREQACTIDKLRSELHELRKVNKNISRELDKKIRKILALNRELEAVRNTNRYKVKHPNQ